MKKDMFYRVVIILLLVLNFGTLGFLWVNKRATEQDKRAHRPPPPPDRIIINLLKLDEQQQEQFSGFRHEHHGQMVQIQKQSSELHKDLFALLQYPDAGTAIRDSILSQIQILNLQKEEVTYYHFEQLRSILQPAQQQKFDDMVEELSERIMGPHRAGKP